MIRTFPFRVITVAFGPDRDVLFADATAYLDIPSKPWLRRIDATGLDESVVLTQILNFVRTGLDQIAVNNPGPEVLARLLALAETGCAVAVSMDVTSLDEARERMSQAVEYPIENAPLVALT